MKIKSVSSKIILDSREGKTIEAVVQTDDGFFKGAVPSGVSTGDYEAVSVGAEQAVKNIAEVIEPALRGRLVSEQAVIDQLLLALDGSSNKEKLGANAILAVSLACCRAGSTANRLPLYQYLAELAEGKVGNLPKPCFLCLEGGRHGQSALSIQEFMVVPEGDIFKENLEAAEAVYEKINEILGKKNGPSFFGLGIEGGFTSALEKAGEALDFLNQAVEQVGSSLPIKFYLDVAASEFFEKGKYNFQGEKISSEQLLAVYEQLVRQYPILLLEDPFEQNNWTFWRLLNHKLHTINEKLRVVGDDLTVTDIERIKLAQENQACNAMIIKPNQIGTITETIKAAKLAKSFGWQIIVSHRGRETMDDFIADLAVGLGAEYIKTGSLAKPERAVKYQRLLAIEEELKNY